MKKERCLLSIALFFIICKAISRERKCVNYVTLFCNCVTLSDINDLALFCEVFSNLK